MAHTTLLEISCSGSNFINHLENPINLSTELIEQTFNREGSLYLACNDKNAFFILNNLNNINCGHVRKCVMRSIIFWTIYL